MRKLIFLKVINYLYNKQLSAIGFDARVESYAFIILLSLKIHKFAYEIKTRQRIISIRTHVGW